MNQLLPSLNKSLSELVNLLKQLCDKTYTAPCPELCNATIGEHMRHIIEMFLCLLQQYNSGVVNYDLRKRNFEIQSDTKFAISALKFIKENLEKPDKKIELQQIIESEEIRIESNYRRELLYNLEHCIHHQALIKVAILKYSEVAIDQNFGVARSTIEYRKQCAQ